MTGDPSGLPGDGTGTDVGSGGAPLGRGASEPAPEGLGGGTGDPFAMQAGAVSATMTKSEREDLQRLIRQREKVLKSAAQLRSKELLAAFENQLAAEYSFDDDEVWKRAAAAAEAEVERAGAKIARRCQELGIPPRFAPSLDLTWRHRGYDNQVEKRRAELRRVAQSRIAAIEQAAIVEIERASVEAQTEIAVAGLTSEAARAFVARLPTIETLMPALSYADVAGEAEPSVVEQLVSPNALRQQRYRDRQRALRNAPVTSLPLPDEAAVTASPALRGASAAKPGRVFAEQTQPPKRSHA